MSKPARRTNKPRVPRADAVENPVFRLIPQENVAVDLKSMFTWVRALGNGDSGEVWEVVRHSDQLHFAMKRLPRHEKWSQLLFETEATMLNYLSHNGIIRMEGLYADLKFFYILTQLGEMDLFARIKSEKYSEADARIVVRRILEALHFMHSSNIVHRDLKPENIIVCEDDLLQPKLIDFADAIHVEDQSTYSELVGTACYMAPERLRAHYGWELKKCDSWAVGVIAYEMVTGKRCFYANKQKELYAKILNGVWRWPSRSKNNLSEEFKDFVQHLLVVDPRERFSVPRALAHPWTSAGGGSLAVPSLLDDDSARSSTVAEEDYDSRQSSLIDVVDVD